MSKSARRHLSPYPTIRQLMRIIDSQHLSDAEICRRAGVYDDFIFRMIQGRKPGIPHVESVAEVLGYELRLVRRGE